MVFKNFNKPQDHSSLLRRFTYITSFILATALPGCSINNEFTSISTKNVVHTSIPEYSYIINYQSNDIKHSYSANFIYDNPFRVTGTKSELNYELDAKFSRVECAELITPFAKNNKNVKLTFFIVNLKKDKEIMYNNIDIPKINLEDRLTETIKINNDLATIRINDITEKWSKNLILNLSTNSNTIYFSGRKTLHTGMKMILYFYKYPSVLSLNHKINFILDSVHHPTVELSVNSISKNIFRQLSMDKYVIKTGNSEKYFLGNNVLNMTDNSFSIYKLIRRKAF